MDNYEILVVEDDPDINGLLCRLLKKQGYSLTAAYSGSEARLLLSSREFDLVLLDLMPVSYTHLINGVDAVQPRITILRQMGTKGFRRSARPTAFLDK